MSTNETLPTKKNEAVKVFESQMNSYSDDLQRLLSSKRIEPVEFMMSVTNSVKRNPKLLECDRKTLMGCIMLSAEMGLLPNNQYGLSYIIPYNIKQKDGSYIKEAQFQIGYQGWLEIFSRNGIQVSAEIVYENDNFVEKKGSQMELIHEPANDGERGARKGAYAIAWPLNTNFPIWTYVSKSDIMKIKEKSPGAESKSSPWKEENDPMGWMWMKTAIKQLAKKLPKTKEIQDAYHVDTLGEVGKSVSLNDDGVVEIPEEVETKEEKVIKNAESRSKQATENTSELFKNKK